MAEQKTKPQDIDVRAHLEKIENPRRRAEALRLLDIFTETTGWPAVLWGDSIIGFGSYHYKYASGHEGDAAIVAFSPRKARLVLYLAIYDEKGKAFLERLGKHKSSVACVYVNKLEDIDEHVLREMITYTQEYVQALYPQA